jgi:hypothetical protein
MTDIQTICLTVGIIALYAIWKFKGFNYEKTIRIGVDARKKKGKEADNDTGISG